jgi:pimeloyl-ACP methyl ester carboxylesterase
MSTTFSRRRLLGVTASWAAVGSVADADASIRLAAVRRVRTPAHFVFVHGAFHGAWCWYKVTAALEAAGHRTTAVDLPSGGIDGTSPASVTLETQAARVLEVLDAAETPVILVGHSAGGPVISTVAEARPEKIAKLVYLTAYLLPSGASIVSTLADDPESLVTPNLIGTPAGALFIRLDSVGDVFYGTSRKSDVSLARTLLKPIGVSTTATPVTVGAAFESVRRFYVGCRRDRAVTAAFQRAMYSALPCERVFSINSDHSPFFSRPRALVRILGAIARA